MNLFEMTFHVEHVDDGLIDTLIDDYEATVGTDHTGHEFVTVLSGTLSASPAPTAPRTLRTL